MPKTHFILTMTNAQQNRVIELEFIRGVEPPVLNDPHKPRSWRTFTVNAKIINSDTQMLVAAYFLEFGKPVPNTKDFIFMRKTISMTLSTILANLAHYEQQETLLNRALVMEDEDPTIMERLTDAECYRRHEENLREDFDFGDWLLKRIEIEHDRMALQEV
jgi:hypothetical protein